MKGGGHEGPIQRVAAARRDAGIAMLVAVVVLALMGIIGLSSLDTVTRDRQVAGFQSQSQTALYAAEGGLAMALALLRQDVQEIQASEGGAAAYAYYNPSGESPARFPTSASPTTIGTGSFPGGAPRFYMDPYAADPHDSDCDADDLSDADCDRRAIRYIGPGRDSCGSGDQALMSMEEGMPRFQEAQWDLRVRGDNPGGTRVDLQGLAVNCHPFDS